MDQSQGVGCLFPPICNNAMTLLHFWAAAPKGPMTYAFTQEKFLLLLLRLLLLCPPPQTTRGTYAFTQEKFLLRLLLLLLLLLRPPPRTSNPAWKPKI